MKREILGTFENDIDKVVDMFTMNKHDFLNSYSYIHEVDYDSTLDLLFVYQEPIDDETKAKNEEIIGNLADLMRTAENMLLEESNGRPTSWNVTGEQLKSALCGHVEGTLNEEQQELFADLCNSMGC